MARRRDRGRGVVAPPAAPDALPVSAAIVANLLILGVIGLAAALRASGSELYYLSVQEDEYLEWATVWAFAGATAAFLATTARRRHRGDRKRWFPLGVGLLCLFVALEEISWGQRLLGYRPPVYFLEHNFQQELNFHNVVSTGLRKLTLKGILLGYGVALPVMARTPATRRWLEALGIAAPPAALIPAFVGAVVLYDAYPWSFTGELVELMMGLGFLFAGLHACGLLGRRVGSSAGGRVPSAAVVALATALVVSLGFANAALSRTRRSASPGALEAARIEIGALQRDFETMAQGRDGRPATRCGVHKRVYSWVEKSGRRELYHGSFAALAEQGLPPERAEFFIDPWNTAFWVRHECSRDGRRQVVFVYSFGPNRRRDSTDWELGGDDIGAVLFASDS